MSALSAEDLAGAINNCDERISASQKNIDNIRIKGKLFDLLGIDKLSKRGTTTEQNELNNIQMIKINFRKC